MAKNNVRASTFVPSHTKQPSIPARLFAYLFPPVATFVLSRISAKTLAKCLPQFTIKGCATYLKLVDDLVYLFNPDENPTSALNNHCKEFIVDGLSPHQAIWLVEAPNRSVDDPVLIYSHGGGYCLGIFPVFISFLKYLYRGMDNERFSILVLDYSLSPKHKFPKQVMELDLLYKELMKTCKKIILGGDSAGGHLCLMFLRWLNFKGDTQDFINISLDSSAAQHNEIQPDKLNADSSCYPKGLLLVSPWINMKPAISSGHRDITTSRILEEMGELHTASELQQSSELLNPLIANDWKVILPKKVLITVGDNENMKDDILKWAVDELGLRLGKEVRVEPDAFHEQLVFLPAASEIVDETTEGLTSVIGFIKSI